LKTATPDQGNAADGVSVSLKYGILGLIGEEPLHGYEVKSRFEAMLGGTWEVNIGQIYSTFQRLERDGLVEAVGARGDRGKLVYRLTDAGRASLSEWLVTPESEPQQLRDSIYLKLLLGSRLANGSMDRLLAGQRSVYLQRLKDLAELEKRAREEDRMDVVLMLRGALLHTQADLEWLDATREEIQNWATESDRRS
jgi:DNA-binding PadR family transcriptional regulator